MFAPLKEADSALLGLSQPGLVRTAWAIGAVTYPQIPTCAEAPMVACCHRLLRRRKDWSQR